jgi:ethanolamine permease
VAGFGSFLICTFLIGTAYISLCCCNAEVTSSLPFAGGAYGMARVSLGLYSGFVIGCVEISEYVVYVAEASIVLGRMISAIGVISEDYIPVWSLLFLIVSCWIQIQGGRIFWRSNAFLAIVSIVILLVYNFSSLNYKVNIANVTSPLVTGDTETAYFIGGFSNLLTVLPLGAWWYVGIETLNLGTVFVAEVCNVMHLQLYSMIISILFKNPDIFSLHSTAKSNDCSW